VDGTSSGPCPKAGSGISSVETLDSTTRDLVTYMLSSFKMSIHIRQKIISFQLYNQTNGT
jgi:hypothetical protein